MTTQQEVRGLAGARIWYQSSTDPDADRPYFTRLGSYLRSVSSPGCEVEAFGIQPFRSAFTSGTSAPPRDEPAGAR
jgi:hypothetical protein